MLTKPVWGPIARDEALTRGLGDAEARMLVEWLVEQADALDAVTPHDDLAARISSLCRRARGIVRFVRLWCHEDSRGAAGQLAAAERFEWPLPTRPMEPVELMLRILKWEARHLRQTADAAP
jgi:hypothetical protein